METQDHSEFQSLIKVITIINISLTYVYFFVSRIKNSLLRLIFLAPIITTFFYLPLLFSSVHFCGIFGFLISWLANFKLLLFAFNQGPLFFGIKYNSISLKKFVYLACLPIKIKQNPLEVYENDQTPDQNTNDSIKKISKNSLKGENLTDKVTITTTVTAGESHKSFLNYAIKVGLLAAMVNIYSYRDYIHPDVILVLYSFHVYFALEILLAIGAAVARLMMGLELEPQFEDPYMATSLQDFWGRRWNLMVPSILRPTVYLPVRNLVTRLFGRKCGLFMGVFATFMVSGLMHEVIFYYLGRLMPTGEVMWFFALHGVCMALEVEVKRALEGKFVLHPMMSRALTIAFVMSTGLWWFFPQFLRCNADIRGIQEYVIFGEFTKDNVQHLYALLNRYLYFQ